MSLSAVSLCTPAQGAAPHPPLPTSGQRNRAANLARMRELLNEAPPEAKPDDSAEMAKTEDHFQPCPCCGGRMRVIEIFQAAPSGVTCRDPDRHLMNPSTGFPSPCRVLSPGSNPSLPWNLREKAEMPILTLRPLQNRHPGREIPVNDVSNSTPYATGKLRRRRAQTIGFG